MLPFARTRPDGTAVDPVCCRQLTTGLPAKPTTIEFEVSDGVGRVTVDGIGAAESELLAYPDGSVIRPTQELPHGIEFKRALMTNAKHWWWRDDPLLASYANKYGAMAKVRFTQDGCVAWTLQECLI